MAFDTKQSEIKKALGATSSTKHVNAALPTPANNNLEKKERYTYALKPSVKEKFDELARGQGYQSTSAFFEDLVLSLYDD